MHIPRKQRPRGRFAGLVPSLSQPTCAQIIHSSFLIDFFFFYLSHATPQLYKDRSISHLSTQNPTTPWHSIQSLQHNLSPSAAAAAAAGFLPLLPLKQRLLLVIPCPLHPTSPRHHRMPTMMMMVLRILPAGQQPGRGEERDRPGQPRTGQKERPADVGDLRLALGRDDKFPTTSTTTFPPVPVLFQVVRAGRGHAVEEGADDDGARDIAQRVDAEGAAVRVFWKCEGREGGVRQAGSVCCLSESINQLHPQPGSVGNQPTNQPTNQPINPPPFPSPSSTNDVTYLTAMAKERLAGGTASIVQRLIPAVQTKRSRAPSTKQRRKALRAYRKQLRQARAAPANDRKVFCRRM